MVALLWGGGWLTSGFGAKRGSDKMRAVLGTNLLKEA